MINYIRTDFPERMMFLKVKKHQTRKQLLILFQIKITEEISINNG